MVSYLKNHTGRTWIMAYEKVRSFFEDKGLADKLKRYETPCDTVAHAAENIGCEEKQIAKTMSFLLKEDKPIVIVCAGDTKISNRKFKDFFQTKAKMVPFDQVEEIIGHEPGGVCPFAVKETVTIYLDTSLKRFTDVYPASGDIYSISHLTIEELETLTYNPEWIDVCEIRE